MIEKKYLMSGVAPALAGAFVFLTAAMLFFSKSAYSFGPALLLLLSLVLLFPAVRASFQPDKETRSVIWVMLIFALIWAGGYWADVTPAISAFDKPLRAILAIPVLILLLTVKPSAGWLFVGLLIGAFSAGGIAIYDRFYLGMSRANGPLNAIQFGNLSMLWGVFCCVVFCYLTSLKATGLKIRVSVFFFLIAAVMGVLGSLLSGSRGGWIGVPFVLLVFWKAYGDSFSWRFKALAIAFLVAASAMVWNTPDLGVQSRINQAVTQFKGYVFEGSHQNTSVGQRLQMWENAFVMAAEKPLTGWGEWGYRDYIFAAEANGYLTPDIEHQHAHNQFFDMLAKHGIPGFLAVIAFFFVPLTLFGQYLKSEQPRHKALAIMGTLLCVCFIDFGITQAIIWHTGGMMVYSFMLVIIWALMKNEQYRGTE